MNKKEKLDKIINDGLKINPQKVADEILEWVTANVEQFIDNQVKTFKIDLVIDGESVPPMPETTKLNKLYKTIPDDDELLSANAAESVFTEDGGIDIEKLDTKAVRDATKVRNSLNEVALKCLSKMQHNEELLEKLYNRMIFYYEMVGFHKGNALLREIKGAVNIIKFEYEAFTVDVQVKSPTFKIQKGDGSVDTIESEAKEYTVPEGFTVWVEIAFAPKEVTTSIF